MSNKPLPLPRLSDSDVARFWSKVDRRGPDECWPWLAGTFRDGYGNFKAARRGLKAPRVAFFLHHGRDADALLVCHTCDNPACCNGAHLYDGTNRDNIGDAKERGRLNTACGPKHGSRTQPESRARGERVGSAKITAADAVEIRRLYVEGESQPVIADRFHVTREAVSRIITGKNWRHVIAPGEPICLSDRERHGKKGASAYQAKLTEADVLEIRRIHSESRVPLRETARKFGVSLGAIRFILIRRTWAHLIG